VAMATLEQATFTAAERRALKRAVEALRGELGTELVAVWLYGSRARGEVPHEDSDIDLLIVVREEPDDRGRRISELVWAAAEAEGAARVAFSPQVRDLRALAEERAIESLYLREVERDKVALAGGELLLPRLDEHELPPKYGPGGVLTRSLRWLESARGYLADAELLLAEGRNSAVIASTAYYAMFYAARAALSEEGRVARKHKGTWIQMRELFAESGRLDSALVARGEEMQRDREAADYDAASFDRETSEVHVRDARGFVQAIERLLGVAGH
jgi:uncharacterized protein (UPF0332 family)/predicted nucleotidyltransferase